MEETKTTLSTVVVRPGEANRLLAGHPWVYHGSILRETEGITDGAVVQVKDHRMRLLGTGVYNRRSKIRVRILDPDRVSLDRSFFERRIRAALELRKRKLPGATSFRLINAESDFLSGLIVDKYEEMLVLQTSSLGMDQRKAIIIDVLQSLLSPRAIIERNESASRKFEGLPDANGIIAGEYSPSEKDPFFIRLNGVRFETDLVGGQKTGFYLDQQENYRKVAELAKGAQVLDCFSFLGGFALHAARAGAAHVHAIDQSETVVAAAQRNAVANGLDATCSFEAANVFDWLKSHTATKPHERVIPRFDLIILDPPSFTRSRASLPDALRGYKEIHLRALKLLRPGGTLATFCCSHHVHASLFEEVIVEAAFDARRILRKAATYTQSPDHPIIPTIPETEYLKGFAYEIAY